MRHITRTTILTLCKENAILPLYTSSQCKCMCRLLKLQSHYRVCQRMTIRSHTLIYVRGTLDIRRVRYSYDDIRRCTVLYAEAKYIFWTYSNIQRIPAYDLLTLLIRYSYAWHTLDTQGIC